MPEQYSLFLQPLGLRLAVTPGETIWTVLQRFNAFRAPEKQLTLVFDHHGYPLPLDTRIMRDTSLWLTPKLDARGV